jgi:hypothetical protein
MFIVRMKSDECGMNRLVRMLALLNRTEPICKYIIVDRFASNIIGNQIQNSAMFILFAGNAMHDGMK